MDIVDIEGSHDGGFAALQLASAGPRNWAINGGRYPATINVLENVDLYVRNDGGAFQK